MEAPGNESEHQITAVDLHAVLSEFLQPMCASEEFMAGYRENYTHETERLGVRLKDLGRAANVSFGVGPDSNDVTIIEATGKEIQAFKRVAEALGFVGTIHKRRHSMTKHEHRLRNQRNYP